MASTSAECLSPKPLTVPTDGDFMTWDMDTTANFNYATSLQGGDQVCGLIWKDLDLDLEE